MALMELERPFPVREGLKDQLKRLALPPEGNQKTLKDFFVCQLRSFSLQEEKKTKAALRRTKRGGVVIGS